MIFSSIVFIFAFLPIVWVAFHIIKNLKFNNSYIYAKAFLVLSSLFFYAFWKVEYLFILLASIGINYLIARIIVSLNEAKVLSMKFGGGGGKS